QRSTRHACRPPRCRRPRRCSTIRTWRRWATCTGCRSRVRPETCRSSRRRSGCRRRRGASTRGRRSSVSPPTRCWPPSATRPRGHLTVPPAPVTVPALLAERAATRADHELLICDDDVLTYADAERRSAELAKSLLAAGVGAGTHVGLLHPNGSAFVVGWLAA